MISGRFYKLEVVGRPGLGEVTGLLFAGPSINGKGQVAFTGQATAVNALFVADLGSSLPRTIATQNGFSFLGAGIKINNAQHVLAVDQSSEPERLYEYTLFSFVTISEVHEAGLTQEVWPDHTSLSR